MNKTYILHSGNQCRFWIEVWSEHGALGQIFHGLCRNQALEIIVRQCWQLKLWDKVLIEYPINGWIRTIIGLFI